MEKLKIPLLLALGATVIIGGAVSLQKRQAVAPSTELAQAPVSTPTPTEETKATVDLPLTVTSPTHNSTVASSTLTVRGKTKAKAQVAVNDIETVADAAGNFSITLTLDEGENILFIIVNDEIGNVTEQELSVIFDSGE